MTQSLRAEQLFCPLHLRIFRGREILLRDVSFSNILSIEKTLDYPKPEEFSRLCDVQPLCCRVSTKQFVISIHKSLFAYVHNGLGSAEDCYPLQECEQCANLAYGMGHVRNLLGMPDQEHLCFPCLLDVIESYKLPIERN